MYDKLIKNYSEYRYNISLAPKKNFLTNKSNFDIEYELKDKDSIVGYCKIEYTPFKMEMISELLELKRKELEYLESQFTETDRTYTNDETIEKDYLRLKTETDKLEIFLKRDEMEKRLSYLEEQKLIYKNKIDKIDEQEIIETNIVNIDAEISDLNDKLGKYPLLYENIVDIITNNLNKLKTLKRKEVIYYDKNKNINYTETFQYKNEYSLTPEETGISELKDSKGKTIGYRYYRNGINNGFNNNDFVTIVEGPDGQYHPIQSTGNYEDDLEIIHSIFRENYKNKPGYEITGNMPKTLGILAIAKLKCNDIFIVCPGANMQKTLWQYKKQKNGEIQTYFNSKTNSIFSKKDVNIDDLMKFIKVPNDKAFTIIPIPLDGHISFALINNKTKEINFNDMSGCHTIKGKPRSDLFGKFFEKISGTALRTNQINGTCSFHLESLVESLLNTNIQDFYSKYNSGELALESAIILGKIFDYDQNRTTVKKFLNDIEVKSNRNRYSIFKMNDVLYGINLEAYNNKFIDIERLYSSICKNENFKIDRNEELKMLSIISQQKHIINIESRYYIRRRFLQNLERLKKYIVNIKYDKNKIITINEKSNPQIKQRLVDVISELYRIEDSIKKWPDFEDKKQIITDYFDLIFNNPDYTKETKLIFLKNCYNDLSISNNIINNDLESSNDMMKYYNLVNNNRLLYFIANNEKISFDNFDVEKNKVQQNKKSNKKYLIEYDYRNKNILIKSTDPKIFKNIDEIKTDSYRVGEHSIDSIISAIEERGFFYLINKKIPIQIKIKGENTYKDIGINIARSLDKHTTKSQNKNNQSLRNLLTF